VVEITDKVYQNGHYGLAGFTLGNIFFWGTYGVCASDLSRGGRFCGVSGQGWAYWL